MSVLVLVEHDGSAIKDATLATVTAARKLGEVHALVAGSNVDAVAAGGGEDRRRRQGLCRRAAPALEHQLAEDVAPVAAKLMDSHDAFVAPATTTGKNIAPRVAALLDVMQISDILSVEGAGHLHPPDLRRQRDRDGQVEGREEGHHRRTTAFEKAAREGGSGARRDRSMPAATPAPAASSALEASKASGPS